MVVRVPNKPHQTIPLSVSHAREALLKGVLIGGSSGLLVGAIVGWAGYRFEGLDAGIVVAFAALGLVLGSLGAALIGPINPHPAFERVEERAGVTLVIHSPHKSDRGWIEELMREHQGEIEPCVTQEPQAAPRAVSRWPATSA